MGVGRHLDSGARLSAPMQGSLSGYLMQRLEKETEEEMNGKTASIKEKGDTASAVPAQSSVDANGFPKTKRHKVDLQGNEGKDGDPDTNEAEDVELEFEELPGKGGTADDTTLRCAQFLKAMRERFVNGLEADFDYSRLDEDSDLDDIVELGRDAEDKYFADD